MGDIGLVAGQDSGVETASDVPGDEPPDRTGGGGVVGSGIEIAERAGVHHLRQHRILSGEGAEHLEQANQVGSWIVGVFELVEPAPQLTEPLEEDLPDEPGLVAEELVDGRDGGSRSLRAGSRRSPDLD